MMKLWNREATKYLLRFGVTLAIAGPIIYFLMGPNNIGTLVYKLCLVCVFTALAELLWAVGYKLAFGRSEASSDKQGILVFRGLFYAAIILAGTLGL